MKVFALLASALILLSFVPQKKQKVIFFGDSITQAGAQPGGYIMRIDSMAKSQGKGAAYEFVGKGIGGNKVTDLYLRLERDVLDLNPDIVIVYVGVNDVWHKRSFGTGIDADKFVGFYQAIIDKVRAKGAKVIMATPAAIGEKTDFSNEQDGDLNKYANIIRDLATKNQIPLVDLRKGLLAYNVTNNKNNTDRGILTTDGVHMNEKGNQWIADSFWKAITNLK